MKTKTGRLDCKDCGKAFQVRARCRLYSVGLEELLGRGIHALPRLAIPVWSTRRS